VSTFTPSRLTLARRRRGLTIGALADRAEISTDRISAFEHDEATPSEATIAALGLALRFPRSFFGAPELEAPAVESVSFRALTTMTASQRDAALGAGALALAVNDWNAARFRLPPVDLPPFRHDDPGAAAEALRAEWGIGQKPIRNMVHLLEAHGVRVFSLADLTGAGDALSFWHGPTPFVFLNPTKRAERSRFDAAHELGHLVLHQHGGPQGREAAAAADRFASAFLMPTAGVLAHVPRSASLQELSRLKTVWGVSIAALTHRLHAVGVLSEHQHQQLRSQISAPGFQTSEPRVVARETSQVLGTVFAALRDEGVSKMQIARELHLHPSDLDALVFGLVLVAVDGRLGHEPRRGTGYPSAGP
jgi:Zn-dependent peptidase ImmA (M78 family)/transcriptional regulator with XRE-family HTH domain